MSNENLVNTSNTEVPAVNYMKLFYQNQNRMEAFHKFFNKEENQTSEIILTNNKIKELQKQLNDESSKLNELYAAKYSSKYTPETRTTILRYSTRNGEDYYYSLITGQKVSVDDYETPIIIDLPKKHGEFKMIDGYCFELGAVIAKYYSYSISGDNNKISLNLKSELIVGVLDEYSCYSSESVTYDRYGRSGILSKLNGSQFVNTMFSVNRETKYNLSDLSTYYQRNPAFETILKTAPDELLDEMLKMQGIDKPKSVASILGLTPELYDKAIKAGIVKQVYQLRPYILNKEKFNKTEEEWIQMIINAKVDEEELDFYQISYGGTYSYRNPDNIEPTNCQLLGEVAWFYDRYEIFRQNYSFSKFYNYVVRESIDEGYTKTSHFEKELLDYLNMCRDQNIAPHLQTTELKKVHDVTARNHKIFVAEHEEEIFKDRYKEFKDIEIDKKYKFIAPKTTKDIQKEGDAMCSCIASYIKKVIDGTCLIVFMRLVDDLAKSYVSIEQRNGEIVQIRGMHNRKPTMEECKAIGKYAEKAGLAYNVGDY